ncbi:MAG: penicillin acylase family protein [Rhodospirillales bacterium]|jgi:penicillin amidase
MGIVRWILRLATALLLLGSAAAGIGVLYLRTGLPPKSGTLAVQGLEARLDILRDEYGIPYVYAQNERDLWFALGLLHAQDRLVQLETTRLIGQGRLAEFAGARALPLDRLNRVLGLAQEARRIYAAMDPDARRQTDAYTAGINAALATRDGAWPVEFLYTGYRPERWEGWHALLWGQLMGLSLNASWRDTLLRARLGDRLTPDVIAALWPQADPARAAAPADTKLAALAEATATILPEAEGTGSASNEWVVAGSRTASGKPILANDPHLSLGAPGIWYLVRLEAPGIRYVGATAPGAPALILGHNGNVAWGFTTTNADAADLFVERLDPTGPTRYLTPEGPRSFETREELLQVKDGKPETLIVRRTRNGAVISDIDAAAQATAGAGQVLSLALPFLFELDRTAEALMRLNRARNAAEAVEATRLWQSPVQNMVYADTAGAIGLRTVGAIPMRASPPSLLPYAGSSPNVGWTGFVPFAQMPAIVDPPSGFASNANDRVVGPDYPHHVSFAFDPAYRQRRIVELLESRQQQDVAYHEAVLADAHSIFAREAVAAARNLTPVDAQSRTALEMLRSWDGRMDRLQPEPLIFTAWMRELTRRGLDAALGPMADAALRERPALALALLGGASPFCAPNCAAMAEAALGVALDELGQKYGRDLKRWQWGAAHRAPFENPIFARLPIVGPLLAVDLPTHGDYYTINRGGMRLSNAAAPYAHVHGAGLRAIYDLADLDSALFVIAPGQSGHPLSPHWRDLAPVWAAGQHVRLARNRAELPPGTPSLALIPRP